MKRMILLPLAMAFCLLCSCVPPQGPKALQASGSDNHYKVEELGIQFEVPSFAWEVLRDPKLSRGQTDLFIRHKRLEGYVSVDVVPGMPSVERAERFYKEVGADPLVVRMSDMRLQGCCIVSWNVWTEKSGQRNAGRIVVMPRPGRSGHAVVLQSHAPAEHEAELFGTVNHVAKTLRQY